MKGPAVLETTFHSPLGPLLIRATERGINQVAFTTHGETESHITNTSSQAKHHLDTAQVQLEEYFSGQRFEFTVTLDPDCLNAASFRGRTQLMLASIPYGTTWSYGQLAHAAGNQKASRAAGTSCATNPVPLLLPCHRVVRGNGALGNYLGGTAKKQWLLDFEHGNLRRRNRV